MAGNIAPRSPSPISRPIADRYGAETLFIDFCARLRCRHCGSRDVSTIVDSHHETPGQRWQRENN